MSYEYERVMGFGADEDVSSTPPAPDTIVGERPEGGSNVSPVVIGGLLAAFGGIVLFALAVPFGVGAISGAIAAPEGHKRRAAKWGALAGGLGGLATYPIVYGLTGSAGISRSMSSLAPIALGTYMGMRERERSTS